jgi:hypothetical protein
MEKGNIKFIRKKQSFSFLLKVLIFILIVFVLDFTIGSMLRYYYFKQTSGFYYRTTYSFEETKADVLIFGSSKANHQFYPDIFEKRLNLSYYNVGRDGSSIFYHYAILQSVLKRYTPKVIILEMTREFDKKQISYDRISMLLPYYESHPSIRPIIEMRSRFEKFKLISKIYPYNSLLFSIISGNSEFNRVRNSDIKGYVPLTREWTEPIQHFSVPFRDQIDSTKIKIFESFIKACNKSGVKLYIVASPNFYIMDYVDKSNLIAMQIARKYGVNFFNYSNDPLFLVNPSYFADNMHLNNKGAIAFSNILIDEINKDYLPHREK